MKKQKTQNWLHYQNGWALKMILIKQQNWLTIFEMIQTMPNQVLAINVFDDLEKLINDIRNHKVKKESAIKRMKKSIAKLEQQRQKESIFQNKMIYVLYYLFNWFRLGKKPLLLNEKNPDQLKQPKWVYVSKERFNEILSTITKVKNDGLKTNVHGREITLDNAESLLKDIASGRERVQQYCWCRSNTVEANAHKKSRKNGRNFIAVKRNSRV